MLIRVCLTSLFLTLLSLAAIPCSAQNGQYSTEVRVSGEIIDEDFLTMTVVEDMRMPTMYNTLQGKVTSEQLTQVMGGANGQDAHIRITGPANQQYSVSFVDRTVLLDASHHTLYIDLAMSKGSVKTPRWLNGSGEDEMSIMGSTTLDGLQQIGYYTNASSPLIVTATVD